MHLVDSLGETGVTPASTDWQTSLTNLLTQGAALYGQIKLQDTNLDLIKRGLPPLSASQIAATAPQFNVGLSPDVKSAIFNYSLVIGLGGLAIFALIAMSKKRR